VRKREEGKNKEDKAHYFYFEWVLELTISRDFTTLAEVDLFISEYGFHPKTSQKTRVLVKRLLTPLVKTKEKLPAMDVKSKKLLEIILQRVEMEDPSTLCAYDTEFPHSLPIRALLQKVIDTMDAQ